MPPDTPDGTCVLCDETYTKQGMTTHLRSCREANVEGARDVFHLVAEGRYRPEFWIHIEIAADATLESLDRFLRGLWLECCGHLSAFTIGNSRYSAQPMGGLDERNMGISLVQVLDEDTEFTYEYDFGTTTELALRVVDVGHGDPEGATTGPYGALPVRLLARNELPDLRCGVCDDPATVVCNVHFHDREGWRCDDCQPDHECEAEMFLPVVNSPRVGMCAYTG